jgi:hypothetical protein
MRRAEMRIIAILIIRLEGIFTLWFTTRRATSGHIMILIMASRGWAQCEAGNTMWNFGTNIAFAVETRKSTENH